MKKNGFTLIELAAVIMILGIIMLIAVPIVLNTIENSKKGAAERSAENYLDTVETTVAWEKTAREIQDGEYTIQEDGSLCLDNDCTGENKIVITMSGNKPSSGTIIIENGTVVDKLSTYPTKKTAMKVNEYTVSYNAEKNGYVAEKIVDTTTVIYRWSTEKIAIGGTINPDDYTADAATLEKRAYLKHVLDKDNKVIESYACGIFNDTEYCVRGGNKEYYGSQLDTGEYTGNLSILKSLETQGVSCSYDSISESCGDPNKITLYIRTSGHVIADGNSYACYVSETGISTCYNQRPGIW